MATPTSTSTSSPKTASTNTNTKKYPDLTSFKALSFDCYGTLIDWEAGLTLALQEPILSRLPRTHPFNTTDLLAVQHFNAHSERLWRTQPGLSYDLNLERSLFLLGEEVGIDLSFSSSSSSNEKEKKDKEDKIKSIGTSPGRWLPFPDTIPGLLKLKKHYKLIILSNVNEANIAATIQNNLYPVEFDAVYTAERIGSYKPALENFRYLFEHALADLGVDEKKGELLHVARGLTADHVPCKEVGLRSVWISRGGDREEGYGTGGNLRELVEAGKLGFEWRFESIGEFADEVERQFAAKEEKEESAGGDGA